MSAPRVDPALRWLLIWAGLHALAYGLLTPLWQAPDEPAHVEMACLLAQRGALRTGDALRAGDADPALQQRLIAALADADFWRLVRQPTPDPLPNRFADDPFLRNAGRQVGDESPIYYWLPALICRLPLALPAQVRLMRLASGLFFVMTVLAMWWATGPLWRETPGARLAATAAVAGLPMLAFLAGGVNNDIMAVLGGTVTFGCLLRLALADRARGRAALALLVMAGLTAWLKKTALFSLPLALLAIAWQFGWQGTRRQRRGLIGLAVLVGLLALLPSRQPAAWGGRGQPWGAGLAPAAARSGRWGMTVTDDTAAGWGRITQALPAAQRLAGQTIRFGAWVRSPSGAQVARLTIRDDAGLDRLAAPVTAAWTWLAVTRTLSITTTQVLVGIAPGAGASPGETGALWVDDAGVQGAPGLVNGDFEQAVTWGNLLAQPLLRPLQDVWATSADAGPANAAQIALYLALLFPGFWGNFGWLQAPLPLPVYVGLALVCLLALLGLGGLWRQRCAHRATAAAIGWSAAAVTLSFALATAPMWFFDWQPQGRYLLPALAPWVVLLVSGLRFWSQRWRLPRAGLWFMAGFGLLDLAALWFNL